MIFNAKWLGQNCHFYIILKIIQKPRHLAFWQVMFSKSKKSDYVAWHGYKLTKSEWEIHSASC